MSKQQILAALPALSAADRLAIRDKLDELDGPAPEEKVMLDQEWAEFEADGNVGAPVAEVARRLRSDRSA